MTPVLDRRWLVGAFRVVLVRPWLWATAVAMVFRLAPAGWWRRRPWLPVPDADYLGFRMQAMYGDAAEAPDPADLVAYLAWCRAWR